MEGEDDDEPPVGPSDGPGPLGGRRAPYRRRTLKGARSVKRLADLLWGLHKYSGDHGFGFDEPLFDRLHAMRHALYMNPNVAGESSTWSLRHPTPFAFALGPTLCAPPAAVRDWREGRAALSQLGEAAVWLAAAAGLALEQPGAEEAIDEADRALSAISDARFHELDRWLKAGAPELPAAPRPEPPGAWWPCQEAVLACSAPLRSFTQWRQDLGMPARCERVLMGIICHGPMDGPFASRLELALSKHTGSRVRVLIECAAPTRRDRDKLSPVIGEEDRVIVFASIASLDCPLVHRVIEATLAREERDDASYLVPVRLDDYADTDWCPPSAVIADAMRRRTAVSFEGALDDPARFDAIVRELSQYLPRD